MAERSQPKHDWKGRRLKHARPPKGLAAHDLDIDLPDDLFTFESTSDVEPLDEIIGQNRAMEALDVGLGITQEGYNIFVAGLTGTGKMGTIRRSLEVRTEGAVVPPDWVFVNNFDEPDRPWAISLKAGCGRKLQKHMQEFVDRLQDILPKAFRQEDFSQEKERLSETYHKRFQERLDELDAKAREHNFTIRQTNDGHLVFVPLIDGRPAENEDEVEKLPEATREDMHKAQHQLAHEAHRLMQSQQDMLGELRAEVHEAERKLGRQVVEPIIDAIRRAFQDNERVREYLERVAEYAVENLEAFRASGRDEIQQMAALSLALPQGHPPFQEYQVNVVVDHGKSETAPIIVEESPNYRNLFGTVERWVDRAGHPVTSYMDIKAGSLLRASGGYLVFNLEDALTEPFVYKQLKRTLRTGQVQVEAHDPWGMLTTGGIRPEPIPIHTKVVALGSPWLFYLLRFYDEEFASIFKVKADFGTEMERGEEQQHQYARFVARLATDEQLRPFTREAVREIIRFSARRTAHKGKLLTRFSEVADLIREANFAAGKQKSEQVQDSHVRAALESRVYRSERIAKKIRELMEDGTLLVTIDGEKIGQVNGLAVIDMGDYSFGKPSRVTSSLGLGSEGVINIEREAKLSGSTHDKAVLILGGYLRNTYGRDKPLAVSASLCFEQSYGGVEGDSASTAELLALLSNLAELPLRQDIAVTGSINQWGEVQAVGGLAEKIEGFYDVCRQLGWTGSQGVCMPASNVKNLVLRPDVKGAVAEGTFHIYPVSSIDETIELLSNVKAGTSGTPGTFHWRVDCALRDMAEALAHFGDGHESKSLLAEKPAIPPDIPPTLPDDTP